MMTQQNHDEEFKKLTQPQIDDIHEYAKKEDAIRTQDKYEEKRNKGIIAAIGIVSATVLLAGYINKDNREYNSDQKIFAPTPAMAEEKTGSDISSSQRTEAKYLPDGVFEIVIDFIVPSMSL